MIARNVASGSSFLFDSTEFDSIFIPEDITKEQQMIVTMMSNFIENEVLPHDEEIENRNYELHLKLLRKTGELGILGADIPEEYGGLGLDKVTGNFISEAYSRGTSFAITMGTQMGIGSLPIVYFGTPEQKRRYLPSLA
ncbi:acyl-CoA dehydrogenase family protein, partial [Psychrobacillus psychrotolerans]|uniref:acyl-CoA dehydrogenase family protein n=1 Tax=Psychrobacillus psychrotolerans TaxID=126156 RepID=UPI00398A1CA5